MSHLSLTRYAEAPPARVYAALLDPAAVQSWMVPEGMTSQVHAFEARKGGAFRITLTYDEPTGAGKTTAQQDAFSGRFARLVPGREVVQVIAFDTTDPSMAGEMTVRYLLAPEGSGTRLTVEHADVPPGVPPEDNALGWGMSLDKLVRLVES